MAERSADVVIVGGGIGGMTAAVMKELAARQLGF
jgi:thioredoxin reductase